MTAPRRRAVVVAAPIWLNRASLRAARHDSHRSRLRRASFRVGRARRAGAADGRRWRQGSSYSAALVFLLAAAHPGDVSAIVAFSPGEYLARKDAVRAAAAKVSVSVYIDQASSAKEVASSAAILRALKSKDRQQLTGRAPSTHGASTLRADNNAAGAEAHWKGLLAFLARFDSLKAPAAANET